MARSLAAAVSTAESEFAEIIGWYEDLLERTTPPTDLAWEPVKIGPTWQWDNGWLLPEHTLGWRVLAWCGVWLRDKRGQPWQFTPEQARFVLWFFALDESGEFTYHSAVLQRLKGWGKDPLAACISVAAMFADVTFSHWDGDMPIGREEPSAWIQIVAVAERQTENTMKLFPSLISLEARKHYGIQVGKTSVYGLADTRQIQAITSNPLTAEGGRPTLVIRNETQNWNASNGGHDMAGAIEGNVTKSEEGTARLLDICNAPRPGEDSVGELAREAWESTQGADATVIDFGLLYDSLEAPPDAPLNAEDAPAVVTSIRGDATWLSTARIVKSILNPSNPASESRRKWYNQITATEDAWLTPQQVRACSESGTQLEPGDAIVMFGDGSKSDDATGIVAVRLSDGFTETLHVQQPKAGQIVNRDAVDYAVIQAFETYKVVAFWFDPSHAKDDDAEGDSRFWWPLVDEWHERYHKRLTIWPVRTGPRRHAIAFDMLIPSSQQQFVPACEQLESDVASGAFRHHGGDRLIEHLSNARRRPNKYGIGIGKEHRESRRKIDLAVCAVGARMVWRLVRLSDSKSKHAPGKGRVVILAD